MVSVTQFWGPEIKAKVLEFIYAPMNNPELMSTAMPLILGGVIMELYFGKHKKESLGWNTSVGNAVIWSATGISLLMANNLSQPELYAVYALIAVGGFVTFMDFFHIWPSSVAFIISSSAVVYTIAYTLLLVIKTQSVINRNTLIAAGIFFVGVNVFFKFVQSLETNEDRGFSTQI